MIILVDLYWSNIGFSKCLAANNSIPRPSAPGEAAAGCAGPAYAGEDGEAAEDAGALRGLWGLMLNG